MGDGDGDGVGGGVGDSVGDGEGGEVASAEVGVEVLGGTAGAAVVGSTVVGGEVGVHVLSCTEKMEEVQVVGSTKPAFEHHHVPSGCRDRHGPPKPQSVVHRHEPRLLSTHSWRVGGTAGAAVVGSAVVGAATEG